MSDGARTARSTADRAGAAPRSGVGPGSSAFPAAVSGPSAGPEASPGPSAFPSAVSGPSVAREAPPGSRVLIDAVRAPGDARTPADEVLSSLVLLQRVAAGEAPDTVRVFSPAPAVAFSRRESLHPRFLRAADAARAAGYLPVVRPAGGRAVVIDEDWLVVDLVCSEAMRRDDGEVFRERGRDFADLARGWGVDARLGGVAGEYCPGEWSVNARGAVKLVGTAQRVVRGARLFTASIPLRLSERAHRLLVEVNGILDLAWDPSTVGSLAEEATVDDDVVRGDVAAHFAGGDAPRRHLHEVVPDLDAALTRLVGDRVVTGSESTVDTGPTRA